LEDHHRVKRNFGVRILANVGRSIGQRGVQFLVNAGRIVISRWFPRIWQRIGLVEEQATPVALEDVVQAPQHVINVELVAYVNEGFVPNELPYNEIPYNEPLETNFVPNEAPNEIAFNEMPNEAMIVYNEIPQEDLMIVNLP
jgi:hypothetical protein